MGRVLLATQPEEWLDRYLESAELRPFTRRTVTDASKLRRILQRIRAQGYVVTDQELEDGIRSVAVPVNHADGTVAAVMNLSAHTSRGSTETIRRELLPELRKTAGLVEEDLHAVSAATRPPPTA